ncbi:permease prefix domain 1-containing protein [Dactylosporangium sp. NPDC051541]|uniref:permease prefix domain 1-containing protein n=1 Tax=Dactylosporangium sp. NPDC051541 TaxID=3363977 RepID=UPI0037AEBEFE
MPRPVRPIDVYVDGLTAALRGPRRARAEMIMEARHSLEDAALAFADDGLPDLAAERRAVAEFGSLPEVAPAYQAELTVQQGRRTATWIALALPLVNVLAPLMWWDSPWSQTDNVTKYYWLLVDHFMYTSFVAAGIAVLALLGFSRGSMRYTRIVGMGAVTFLPLHALLGAAVLGLSLYQWPGAATWPPLIAGMTFNLGAFAYAGLQSIRCVQFTGGLRMRAPAGA